MSLVSTDPILFHHHHDHNRRTFKPVHEFQCIPKRLLPLGLNCTRTPNRRANACSRHFCIPKALSSSGVTVVETSESSNVTFSKTFELKRHEKLEGNITIRLHSEKNEDEWKLTVGCSLPGKWILHWGVNYIGDVGREWDQPSMGMRPPGSIPIKDYAIETPFKKLPASLEREAFYEVNIDFDTSSSIAAINFVLKDEESGKWYQHKGRDFKVSVIDYLQHDGNAVGVEKGSGIWPGVLGHISNMLLKPEAADSKGDDVRESNLQKRPLQGFCEEHSIIKDFFTKNSMTVSVRHCRERAKYILHIETDLPGDVVIHWGVCRDEGKKWEIPPGPYPPETISFKNKALHTRMQHLLNSE